MEKSDGEAMLIRSARRPRTTMNWKDRRIIAVTFQLLLDIPVEEPIWVLHLDSTQEFCRNLSRTLPQTHN
jgi:hypothetical protein